MRRAAYVQGSRFGPGMVIVAVACLVLSSVYSFASERLLGPEQAVDRLGLKDYLRKVLAHNETLQIRILDMEISRMRYRGERGIFEPEFVTTYDHLETERQNTAEQQRSQNVAIFEERNNIYSGGLEALVPSGGRVRLGYTMSDLNNNLLGNSFFGPLGFTNQYSSFLGLTLTQPLLKNGGRAASMANIRVAALASDIAFQEYRRQLMLLISAAEAAYWNLYLAQEQLLLFRESVQLAETILRDNRERVNTGRGSELEVMEAQSALALRKSRQSEALQQYYEAANRMAMLYSESVVETNHMILAVDEPRPLDNALDRFVDWQTAFDSNPDYLAQRKRLLQENIRLAYARNQRYPQLDLKASYGLNGLGETPWDSWDEVERGNFPSWSIGFELRVPLGGGIKARNEHKAAKVRLKQSLLTLKELETQIANGLDTAVRKVRSSSDGVESYKAAVQFSRSLLDTQLERLRVGRVESRKVLETEAEAFEARNSLVQALVNYRRAVLELELIQGTILKYRNLDLSLTELESRTSLLAAGGDLTEERYAQFIRYLQWAYRQSSGERPQDGSIFQEDASGPSAQPADKPAGLNDERLEEALRLLRAQPAPEPKPSP